MSHSTASRRDLLKAGGLGLLLFNVGGVERWLSPRSARAEAMPLGVLSAPEVALLEAFGETLLPGAREAGIAHFVDHHLALPPADSLLMLRYLDVPPPYAPFYQLGLASLDRVARASAGKPFVDLDSAARDALVGRISHDNPPGWQGPPAPLFYFAVRADAVDVVFGTEEGFAKLGIPYLAHIDPPTPW